ncbi:MAG: C69 family dipeptidase [Acidobacteria bacterium]|nr:C69 family dipeptidase [Acidobacteriota bacterium]
MCDTVVVVRPEGVLFAKNSDRDPNEAQILEWHPGREHPPGARVQCTWIEVPQVRRTRACLLSRPFWMWGAEMGTNEDGVTIGNEAVFTREPYEGVGLTGMDLVRLALERASSARSAVDVIRELLERHGQGGGCGHENRRFTYHNSFLVADPGEAYVLETAGTLHAVERVEGVRAISNGLTIPGFTHHGDALRNRVSRCRTRRARVESLAAAARGPGHLIRVLRDHGEGHAAPVYSWLTGAMGAPCMHAGGVLAASQTTASWVATLGPGGGSHWVTGTAAPCTGLFKPVSVDTPVDLGSAPSDRDDGASLWWRHERLHRRVLRAPRAMGEQFVGERDALEAVWLKDPPPSTEAFAEGDRRLDAWTARARVVQVADRRPGHVRRYWRRRNRRAGLLA